MRVRLSACVEQALSLEAEAFSRSFSSMISPVGEILSAVSFRRIADFPPLSGMDGIHGMDGMTRAPISDKLGAP